MHRKLGILAAILLLCSLATAAPPAAAQNLVGLAGTVVDLQEKPMSDILVILKSVDTGVTYTLKTDKNGAYKQIGMRPGGYEVTLKHKDKDVVIATLKYQLQAVPENHLDINLKKLAAQSPEIEAARKRQEETQTKFEGMKAAFTAGQTKTDQADKARADMMKAPADQRAPLQDKVNGIYQEALQDFRQAEKLAPDKDPNLHLVYFRLGYVNEMMRNYNDSIAAYQKAIDLKPTSPEYYNSLGLALAKAGKIPEATQACEKASSLDPSKGAMGWLNLGIVLYNANRLPEAVEPLKKATTLNPNNPQAWYLLGGSLVAMMEVKQEGDKMIPVLKPGTVEAYQKCLELDPNGPWGAQAKEGLAQLQAMGAGVDTKIKVKKTKP
ncbi:MAG TPA: tetratricopeptide repeat protein [Candidatus Acidoferrales bacterium]|nr:tetratricopeptide repeat protein [Candidatus Acidoferrales bacterium]